MRDADGTCTEYPPDRYVPSASEDTPRDCASSGGTWSSGPCPRERSLGDCAAEWGQVIVYYPTFPAEPRAQCEAFGWRFFASPSYVAPPPEVVAAPAAPETPPAAPPHEPSYTIERPSGFVEWDAPHRPGIRNLEAHRSARGYGPTDAHVVLIVRSQVFAPEAVAGGLQIDWAAFEREGVQVRSHRDTDSAGAPGVRYDTLSTTDRGEVQHTYTLQVLDGTVLYTTTCGSLQTTSTRWRRDCERALDSFRIVQRDE
ncbi:hypothetical protein [Sandaracinus amylolyticus]|uniref:hypothetical protein n=1 Tax=Sandaracinus amylolyticus TaxID=927083 RepID=UPI001F33AD58|nr:hypothetical protein [Sandaracinus amylolyticus]UJR83018.1 Hypothetical protein I5071_50830 [Sandaracinus amylolyticus]